MGNHDHGGRDLARKLTAFVAAVLVGALLLLWAWNTVAVGLLGAPEAGFRHGLALASAIAGAAALIGATKSLCAAKLRRHGPGEQRS